MAGGTGLIAQATRFLCRTLPACLVPRRMMLLLNGTPPSRLDASIRHTNGVCGLCPHHGPPANNHPLCISESVGTNFIKGGSA